MITPELALKVGQAAGLAFHRGDHRHRVVISKDTRLSGLLIEAALQAGFTPSAWMCCCSADADAGAGHADALDARRSRRDDLGLAHPYEDNGIKLFGPDGFKLSDDVEKAIEACSTRTSPPARQGLRHRPRQAHRGRAGPLHRIRQAHLPRNLDLDGPAHRHRLRQRCRLSRRARSVVGLGAEVVTIGNEPDGFNINRVMSAPRLQPRSSPRVREVRADIGIALDGDADASSSSTSAVRSSMATS